MNLTIGELRELIREEQFRGVPEFAIREATRKYVAELRQWLRRHVQQTRNSDAQARDVLERSEESLAVLEEKLNKVVDEELWSLLQSI